MKIFFVEWQNAQKKVNSKLITFVHNFLIKVIFPSFGKHAIFRISIKIWIFLFPNLIKIWEKRLIEDQIPKVPPPISSWFLICNN